MADKEIFQRKQPTSSKFYKTGADTERIGKGHGDLFERKYHESKTDKKKQPFRSLYNLEVVPSFQPFDINPSRVWFIGAKSAGFSMIHSVNYLLGGPVFMFLEEVYDYLECKYGSCHNFIGFLRMDRLIQLVEDFTLNVPK